jgi:hypothetical protein|tara:strand:- start:832 stop:996 length:165 start_codon:yes stop_codon:yes gene_type:complete
MDKINCFICGNFLTVVAIPTQTIVETVILGLLGGFVAMLSKDIYNYIKSLLKGK